MSLSRPLSSVLSRSLSAPVGGSQSDPLASYSYDLRLQTHRGDNVPLGINPSSTGLNPMWEGIVGEATQPTASFQYQTLVEAGTPFLRADGVDDWMSIGSFGGQQVYTVLMKTRGGGVEYGPIESSAGYSPPDYWSSFSTTDGTFGNVDAYPVAVRAGGVALGGVGAVIPNWDEWTVLTVKTKAGGGGATRGIGQRSSAYFGPIDIIAVAIHTGNPAIGAAQIIATEAYFETLKPPV